MHGGIYPSSMLTKADDFAAFFGGAIFF